MPKRNLFKGYYALRWKILERDNFTCQYCGQKAPDVRLEVDHVVAVEGGGTDSPDNLKTSCWACNKGKASLSIMVKRTGIGKVPNVGGVIGVVRKARPFQEFYPPIIAPRRNEALNIIKEAGSMTGLELARTMNITKAYAHVLISRLKDKTLIYKKDNKWYPVLE